MTRRIPPHSTRARPFVGHRAFRHRHVSSRAALRSARTCRRRHRGRADEPAGVLPVDGLWPDHRRPDLRHGRAQDATLCQPRAVRSGRRRLGTRAQHRMADRVPLHPGTGCCRRHGDPARHRARPAHRKRGGTADVAADAGVFRVANPCAADRQPGDRGFGLACRLLGGHRRRGAGDDTARYLAQGDAARRASRGKLVL